MYSYPPISRTKRRSMFLGQLRFAIPGLSFEEWLRIDPHHTFCKGGV